MPDKRKRNKGKRARDAPPRPAPPACVPPRALLPASLARVCSSLTTSSSASGTRRYFICPQKKVISRAASLAELWGKAPTHRATADVALFDFPKAIALCASLVYLAERDVHEIVAVDEMSVECFSVLELHQLRGNVQVINESTFRGANKGHIPWACFVRH